MTDEPREVFPMTFLDKEDEANFMPVVVPADLEEEVDPTDAPAVQIDDALAGAAPQPSPSSAPLPPSSSNEKSGKIEPPAVVTPSVEPPVIQTPGSPNEEKTTRPVS